MPQFRLTTDHYINDTLLPAGTIVGDDTSYPYRDRNGEMLEPSLGMVGVDEESHKIVQDTHAGLRRDPVLPEGPAQRSGASPTGGVQPTPGDMGDATSDMTLNKPNPNLSPGAPDPSAGGTRMSQPQRNAGVLPPAPRTPPAAPQTQPSTPTAPLVPPAKDK